MSGTRTTLTLEGDVQVILPNAIPVPVSHAQAEPKLSYKLLEAAEISGISDASLRLRVRDGSLKARKFGRDYIIMRTDLEAFLLSLPLAVQIETVS